MDYVNNYLQWLKNNIDEYKINDKIYRITLPFTDINNTSTEIYIVENNDNSYTITDDGYTFSEFNFNEFDYKTKRRSEIINSIIIKYGVSLGENYELFIECTKDTLAFKKHLLVQCIIKISDLCILSQNNIKTLFNEDVENYFEEIDVRYMKDISFIGKSGLQSNYDFGIGKTKKYPERAIKLVNNFETQQVRSLIFSWEDIKKVRNKNNQLITIINDKNKKVSKSKIDALKEYNILSILWSEKELEKNKNILIS